MIELEKIFLAFMLYSIIGWIMEVIVTLPDTKKFVNRGFLIGPYCPIYGTGFLGITLLLEKYMAHPIGLFFLIIVLCSAIEYITSLIMEKLFKARWWDYSNRLLNIDGRVCLTNSLAFGFLGMIALYYINPHVEEFINSFSISLTHILSITLFVVIFTDFIISFNIMNKFKDKIKLVSKDNTAEIKEKINELLNNNILTRRVKDAFPNYTPILIRQIKKIKEKINKK